MLKEKLRWLDTIGVMLLTLAILDRILFVRRADKMFFTADQGGSTRINIGAHLRSHRFWSGVFNRFKIQVL